MTDKNPLFTQALEKQLAAAALLGVTDGALSRDTARFGGLAAMQRLLRRGQPSAALGALGPMGKAALSPEALAVQPAWTGLFTDEEADICLENLLKAGAFGRK